MNAPIFNREKFQHPADYMYQVQRFGRFPNVSAGVIQIIDKKAGDSIVPRFNAAAANPNFPGMLIDHEHFKHDLSKETTAYGWLMKLENRDDGIYGQIRWTGTGKAAVDNGDYRFFSTEFDAKDCQILNDGQPREIRPLRLDGLTLTNAPNTPGGRPITNRRSAAPQPQPKTQPHVSMADMQIRINNRTNKLIAETGMPRASCYLQAVEEVNQEEANSPAEPVTNRGGQAPDHRAVMNRARELAGSKTPSPSHIIAAQRELGCGLSEEKPPVKNRGSDSAPGASVDAGGIAARAAELQRATPGLSLATAFSMAQAGTVRNRGAATAPGAGPFSGEVAVKAFSSLVHSRAASFREPHDVAWDHTASLHPELHAAMGLTTEQEKQAKSASAGTTEDPQESGTNGE